MRLGFVLLIGKRLRRAWTDDTKVRVGIPSTSRILVFKGWTVDTVSSRKRWQVLEPREAAGGGGGGREPRGRRAGEHGRGLGRCPALSDYLFGTVFPSRGGARGREEGGEPRHSSSLEAERRCPPGGAAARHIVGGLHPRRTSAAGAEGRLRVGKGARRTATRAPEYGEVGITVDGL